MSKFKELNKILMHDHNVDYWSDSLILLVNTIMQNFTEDDWNQLNTSWEAKPIYWRRQLAHALFANKHPSVFNIFAKMLTMESEVAMEAVDSLYASEYDLLPLKQYLESLKERLLEAHQKEIVQELIDRK